MRRRRYKPIALIEDHNTSDDDSKIERSILVQAIAHLSKDATGAGRNKDQSDALGGVDLGELNRSKGRSSRRFLLPALPEIRPTYPHGRAHWRGNLHCARFDQSVRTEGSPGNSYLMAKRSVMPGRSTVSRLVVCPASDGHVSQGFRANIDFMRSADRH